MVFPLSHLQTQSYCSGPLEITRYSLLVFLYKLFKYVVVDNAINTILLFVVAIVIFHDVFMHLTEAKNV